MPNLNLENFRNKIDMADDKILELLNEKMSYVRSIGETKQTSGGAIYRPERERAIINRLKDASLGLLDQNAIKTIHQEILAVSRNLEILRIIAYSGPEGTCTHQAARSRFGAISRCVTLATIEGVFRELSSKKVKYGVVPVKDNTEGAVGVTLDYLGKYGELKIFGEIHMDTHHSFVGINGNLKEIRRVYSHPRGYSQCRKFLESYELSNIEFVPSRSAVNAAYLAPQDEYSVVICSRVATKLCNVPVLFDGIEDDAANRTRFLILSDVKNPEMLNCKAPTLAHTAHKPGGFSSLLEQFKEENINLTKFRSHPIKSKEFLHSFYVDFKGRIDDENVQRALKNADEVVWLGSYLSGEKNEIQ